MKINWIDPAIYHPGSKVERVWVADVDGDVMAFERAIGEAEWLSLKCDDGGDPLVIIQWYEFNHWWMPYEPPPPRQEESE